MMKKIISWNVNGIRACIKNGFLEFVKRETPDIICIQETKVQDGQIEITLPGYHQYWNYAQKKGYSGTAVFAQDEPIKVSYGMEIEKHDTEGRIITLEYPDYFLTTVYTPNSQQGLTRLEYRMQWEDDFLNYIKKLEADKPVIFCGDLNVAHKEIDLKNYKSNRNNAGFTDEERGKFDRLINSGFSDSFRYLYPDKEGAYTWWSYMFNAREKNVGWRIDYFLMSDILKGHLADTVIYSDIIGSDHCPVGIFLK
jgi:exodeoxyribonuclease-3